MKKEKNYLVSAILMFIGTICFGIVTYGHFYRNDYAMGILCFIAALCDFTAFIINIVKYRNSK